MEQPKKVSRAEYEKLGVVYLGGAKDHAVEPQLFPKFRNRLGRVRKDEERRDPRQRIDENPGDAAAGYPDGREAITVFTTAEKWKFLGLTLEIGKPQALPRVGSDLDRAKIISKVNALDFLDIVENFNGKPQSKPLTLLADMRGPEAIAVVSGIDSLGELVELAKGETRKGVIAAIEARSNELQDQDSAEE